MRSIGRDPIFIASGNGPTVRDVDGNEYIDWVSSWGPLILGHAHPGGRRRDRRRRRPRDELRRSDRGRGALAAEVVDADPVGRDAADDLLGDRGDDERAAAGAGGDRTRADTEVRRRVPRPCRRTARGGRLWPRDGRAFRRAPESPRPPAAATVIVPWNDQRAVVEANYRHRARGGHRRADPGEHGRRSARGRLPRGCCAS